MKRQGSFLWFMVSVFSAATIYVLLSPTVRDDANVSAHKSADRKAWDESAEGTILRTALPDRVDPRYQPVLIYRYRGTNRAAFTAVGTRFEGTNGPIIATVEHLVAKKFANELFVVRPLCPDTHQVTNGIAGIAHRNIDVGLPGDIDVIFLKPGDPVLIDCFSERTSQVPQSIDIALFDNVQVGRRVITSLKSLIDGKVYKVLGASTGPKYLLLDYNSKAGESGTGFIDEYGQLYVLVGGTRRTTSPVSLVSGPYERIEKRM